MLVVGRSELDDPSAAESGLDIAMIMAHMSLETLEAHTLVVDTRWTDALTINILAELQVLTSGLLRTDLLA